MILQIIISFNDLTTNFTLFFFSYSLPPEHHTRENQSPTTDLGFIR